MPPSCNIRCWRSTGMGARTVSSLPDGALHFDVKRMALLDKTQYDARKEAYLLQMLGTRAYHKSIPIINSYISRLHPKRTIRCSLSVFPNPRRGLRAVPGDAEVVIFARLRIAARSTDDALWLSSERRISLSWFSKVRLPMCRTWMYVRIFPVHTIPYLVSSKQ